MRKSSISEIGRSPGRIDQQRSNTLPGPGPRTIACKIVPRWIWSLRLRELCVDPLLSVRCDGVGRPNGLRPSELPSVAGQREGGPQRNSRKRAQTMHSAASRRIVSLSFPVRYTSTMDPTRDRSTIVIRSRRDRAGACAITPGSSLSAFPLDLSRCVVEPNPGLSCSDCTDDWKVDADDWKGQADAAN